MTATAKRKTRRLFFALWPDDAAREALAHATRKAVRASGGRPLPAVNWHTTLAFLGAVEEERMASVLDAAERVQIAPFRLRFDRLEHWSKAAILCATASTPPREAEELARSLLTSLTDRGFAPDLKPWRAHVTLARKVVKPHVQGAIEPVEWRVEGFALVESETLQEGPRYTVLERWPARATRPMPPARCSDRERRAGSSRWRPA